jgi:endoglycosylceramidase
MRLLSAAGKPICPQLVLRRRRALDRRRAGPGSVVAAPLALLATLIAATGCMERGPLSPPTLEPLIAHVDGAWFRDAKRRIVLLRGANYVQLARGADAQIAEREKDFQWLAALGFNLIRLTIAWSSLEPRPGAFDTTYLRDEVDPLLRFASNAGMQVVLAMQQVRPTDCFPGEGAAPAWTCAHASRRTREDDLAPEAASEFRAARAQCAFFRGAETADGTTLRQHFAEAWRLIAHYYEQDKRIVAFDLLDEPGAAGCLAEPTFVADVLVPYYAELQRDVRDAGAPQAIAYQPAVRREDALAGAPRGIGPGAVLAPHLYGQTYGPPAAGAPSDHDALAADYARALALARALGGPLLLGEIGGDAPPRGSYRPTTPGFIAASFAELDRLLVGGAVWAFVARGEERFAAQPVGIGNEAAARALARPYARRIAGLPTSMALDEATGEWRFSFRDDPDVAPPDPTEIFVPARRRYPGGFSVEVSPGDRWTFDERTQRLLLYRGGGDEHWVRIAPRAR